MRIVRRAASACLVAALFIACGYDWTVVRKTDATASDSGVDDATVSSDAAAVDSGPAPIACTSNQDCPAVSKEAVQYCMFPDRLCGTGKPGVCVPSPAAQACNDAEIEVTCTCTGQLLKSRCVSASFGLDLSVNAACEDEEVNVFRCGFLFCPTKTFCVEKRSEGTVDYACVGFSCAERSCSCPEAGKACVGGSCDASDGGVIVRCGAR